MTQWSGVMILLLPLVAHGQIPQAERRSDTQTLSPQLRAMQQDDAANPGMLAVLDGAALWDMRPGGTKSCADCHGDAAQSMRGVAARYPAWSAAQDRPVDLGRQIEFCRTTRQGAAPLPPEHPDRLALDAFVARQSLGMPIAPPDDPWMQAARDQGQALFTQRIGQVNLACANCHDDHWGQRLAGAPIPQGHPVGYPVYRLEWQGLGSLQRRIRNCMTGVRAEPLAVDSPEMVALEAFLMERAKGLMIESPAVRP